MEEKPLCLDFYCGLGGWAEGFLAEEYEVIGFDVERHDYGTGGYPGQLILQDVCTLFGAQFKSILHRLAVIVSSPPCQKYSYMAMPWKRAKAMAAEYRASAEKRKELTAMFDACFRIQREASEAAGRHIPLIVENVKGAQPWVGRAQWAWGSWYLWGDVPMLMPPVYGKRGQKGFSHNAIRKKDWPHDKRGSAKAAKCPFDLSRYIAAYYRSGVTNGNQAPMAGASACGVKRRSIEIVESIPMLALALRSQGAGF